MNKTTTSNGEFRALNVLASSCWVLCRNKLLFLILAVAWMGALTHLIDHLDWAIRSTDTILFQNGLRENDMYKTLLFLCTVFLHINFLKVIFVNRTLRTLQGYQPPPISKMYYSICRLIRFMRTPRFVFSTLKAIAVWITYVSMGTIFFLIGLFLYFFFVIEDQILFAILSLAAFIVFPIYLYISIYVLAPIILVEQIGFFHGFARSNSITRGCRWQIFWIILSIMTIIAFLFIASVYLLETLNSGVTDGPLGKAVMWTMSTIIATFDAVVVTVCYSQLRTAKEGPWTLAKG